MEVLHTQNAPQPIGPYVQGVSVNGMIYLSGMLAINPTTGKIEAKTIEAMTEQIMQNITAVLAQADAKLTDVAKTTIYLADMNDFAAMNEVYSRYFADHKPARTCIAVKTLPLGAQIEVEVIASGQKL